MKNNYKHLAAAIELVIDARKDQQKVANLRTGVIAGGPSIDGENATWESASASLCDMATEYLENGARLSKIEEMLKGCPCIGMDPILDSYR